MRPGTSSEWREGVFQEGKQHAGCSLQCALVALGCVWSGGVSVIVKEGRERILQML